MFKSQKRGAMRKPFQKPNILRRKPKAKKLTSEKINTESCDMKSLSSTGCEIRLTPLAIPVLQTEEQLGHQQFQIVETPTFAVLNIGELYDENQVDTSQTLDINGDSLTIYAHNAQVDNSSWNIAHNTLNVESFLNDTQNKGLFNIDETLTSGREEAEPKPKWCLDYENQDIKDTTTQYVDGSQVNNIHIDEKDSKTFFGSLVESTETTHGDVQVTPDIIVTSQDCYSIAKFVCSEPTCNKSFWSEACLEKHKNCHKEKKPVILHCPVKNTDADGVETKCCRSFLTRKLLYKHLNEDHSPEDALYKCGKCGRRFFWTAGARQHQASDCGRAYVCMWPGCGRVFRQPCRLREHARAHTGDRPYACHYPGCSWSFRSNSKLVRHARRHTGERRHACLACGRAFLRREHLREHAARHHATTQSLDHPCTQPDCERSFSTLNSLVAHVKKVHKKQEGKPQAAKRQKNSKAKKGSIYVSAQIPKQEANSETTIPHSFEQIQEGTFQSASIEEITIERDGMMVKEESFVIERDGAVENLEERCARTHCTWPLQRRQDLQFALEEDAEVERAGSESCESNIYTVRSDLFLHGNLLVNEDNEFIISRATTGGESNGAAEDSGTRASLDELGLIDSHPTGDLTQEELMYADAVDESSFRVFLLNGEELT